MLYRVKLTNFEGPLDLLLFLIKKKRVDIYDIRLPKSPAISEYVAILQMLDLEGGRFHSFSGHAHSHQSADVASQAAGRKREDEEDPRQELVRRLLEYRATKKSPDILRNSRSAKKFYSRGHLELSFDHNDFSEWAGAGNAACSIS
jgi:segregation and condensation protein A